jgi:hypothetical protein
MADLLMASGALDGAEKAWRALAAEAPENADIAAALGALALRREDAAGARQAWKRAIELGVTDPFLCFRYANLASTAGLPDLEIRTALERAIALKPDFDDARFSLAMLEKNGSRFESAIGHLRAMRTVAPARAYHYWTAMADALTGLDRRDEAMAAARRAAAHAASAEERARASQLAYIASTDVAVRLARDSTGATKVVTTRVPHESTDFNPFIEPEDVVRRAAGALREIDCAENATRFIVETPAGPIALAIPDPSRLQVRNGPPEFICGPQPAAAAVNVVYAAGELKALRADGVLRGIEFK